MKKPVIQKLLDHPNKDEIISRLVLDVPEVDINIWLSTKYPGEKKLILTAKDLKDFKDSYLDIYNHVAQSFAMTKTEKLVPQVSGKDGYYDLEHSKSELYASLRDNKSYQQRVNAWVDAEVDIERYIKGVLGAVEARVSQMFDYMQTNPNNFQLDYKMVQWFQTLASFIEKLQKIKLESPSQQNMIGKISEDDFKKQSAVFYDAIRETLAEIDYETSLIFMEKFAAKLAKLNQNDQNILNAESRLEKTQVLIGEFNEK